MLATILETPTVIQHFVTIPAIKLTRFSKNIQLLNSRNFKKTHSEFSSPFSIQNDRNFELEKLGADVGAAVYRYLSTRGKSSVQKGDVPDDDRSLELGVPIPQRLAFQPHFWKLFRI